MLCFESDLQRVRASPAGKTNLDESRLALAEAAILADINAAVEEEEDSGDAFSDGEDDEEGGFDDEQQLQEGPGSLVPAILTGGAILTAVAQGHSSTSQLAVVPDAGPSLTADNSPESLTSKHAASHSAAVEGGFPQFSCGCALARAKGHMSCLDAFTKGQLRTIHQETYGPAGARHNTHAILTHIHEIYYALATPLADGPDALGRTHKMGPLKLLGNAVCGAAFRRAVGGTRNGHRERLAMVLRGFGPSCTSALRLATLQLKAEEPASSSSLMMATPPRH